MNWRWSLACESEKGVLLKGQFGGLIGLFRLGWINGQQLKQLVERAVAVNDALASCSKLLVVKAGDLRRLKGFEDAGKGAVGLLPIELDDNEPMVLVADEAGESGFVLWWIHLYFE